VTAWTARGKDPEPAPQGAPTPAAVQGSQTTPPDANADDEPAPDPVTQTPEHDRETLELLKVFVDSLDEIERNYVKPVDRRELLEAAIQGMLEKLDPHSSFIAPKEVERFRAAVENQFGGIGIQVSVENGAL
jgi:carboxyl-terminal processing protease